MLRKLIVATLAVALACTAALAQYDFSKESEELAVNGETVQQAADQAAQALQQTQMKLSISAVGFDITAGSEAERYLQDTAKAGGGSYFTANDAGQLSSALSSAASGQASGPVGPPAAANVITLTAPRDGDMVGPSIEIIGRTGPGQLVVISTRVLNADTGEQLRVVPGIRNRASVTGEFTFRIATPRVSFSGGGVPPKLRYELHAFTMQADGSKGPEVVVNLLEPK